MSDDRIGDADDERPEAGPLWADSGVGVLGQGVSGLGAATARRAAGRAAGPAVGVSARRAADQAPSSAQVTAQFEALQATLARRFDALDAEAVAARGRDELILERLDALAADVKTLQTQTAAVAQSSARLERRTVDWRYAPYWALGAAGVVLVLAILL